MQEFLFMGGGGGVLNSLNNSAPPPPDITNGWQIYAWCQLHMRPIYIKIGKNPVFLLYRLHCQKNATQLFIFLARKSQAR